MVSHTKIRSKLARAVAGVCRMEPLEDRQMLTTLNGGDVFLYKDNKTDIFRITVLGNTQAEFVAAAVDDQNNVTLGDLVQSDATNGEDLFAAHVLMTGECDRLDAQTGGVRDPVARIFEYRGSGRKVISHDDTVGATRQEHHQSRAPPRATRPALGQRP